MTRDDLLALALRFAAGCLYRVAHRLYDLARRIDRYRRGVPWRDAG